MSVNIFTVGPLKVHINMPQVGYDPPIIMLVSVYLNLTHANESHHGWTIVGLIYVAKFEVDLFLPQLFEKQVKLTSVKPVSC